MTACATRWDSEISRVVSTHNYRSPQNREEFLGIDLQMVEPGAVLVLHPGKSQLEKLTQHGSDHSRSLPVGPPCRARLDLVFLYRHVHLYNAPLDLKIGVLVLQASVRKWEMNILYISIISV